MRVWRKALHREEWQPWFAWHPVEVGGSFVWLEWVERRRCYAVIDEWWEVRLPDRGRTEISRAPHEIGTARSLGCFL
jgi:hypothetical protein